MLCCMRSRATPTRACNVLRCGSRAEISRRARRLRAAGHHCTLAPAGFACLAEALAGSGELARARSLLDVVAADFNRLEPVSRAYLLATRRTA